MPLRSSERARRAMARALVRATELVQIDDQDPDDQIPFSDPVVISPEDLFVTTGPGSKWTFGRVGINDDAAFRIFRAALLEDQNLPATVVQNLQQNDSFMALAPSVAIGLVYVLVMRELDNA